MNENKNVGTNRGGKKVTSNLYDSNLSKKKKKHF